jgi:hypothetical protein
MEDLVFAAVTDLVFRQLTPRVQTSAEENMVYTRVIDPGESPRTMNVATCPRLGQVSVKGA